MVDILLLAIGFAIGRLLGAVYDGVEAILRPLKNTSQSREEI